MSHDPGLIRTEAIAGAVLTGNYALGMYNVLANARIIDNPDAAVPASVSAIIPLTLSIRLLLAEKNSAKSRADPDFVYVKKLKQAESK